MPQTKLKTVPPPRHHLVSEPQCFEPVSECWRPLVAGAAFHSLPKILGGMQVNIHTYTGGLQDTQLLLTECPTCKGPKGSRVVLSANLDFFFTPFVFESEDWKGP